MHLQARVTDSNSLFTLKAQPRPSTHSCDAMLRRRRRPRPQHAPAGPFPWSSARPTRSAQCHGTGGSAVCARLRQSVVGWLAPAFQAGPDPPANCKIQCRGRDIARLLIDLTNLLRCQMAASGQSSSRHFRGNAHCGACQQRCIPCTAPNRCGRPAVLPVAQCPPP